MSEQFKAGDVVQLTRDVGQWSLGDTFTIASVDQSGKVWAKLPGHGECWFSPDDLRKLVAAVSDAEVVEAINASPAFDLKKVDGKWTIAFPTVTLGEWNDLEDALAQCAIFSSNLSMGEDFLIRITQ